VLAVNKMDNPHSQEDAYNFYTLGMGDPFPISATLGIGIGDVLDEIVSHLPIQETEEEEGEKPLEIAVIGKPNVGKSSLVNYMLGTTRVIVEDMPGTTRDAIDTPFTRDGQDYILIDTAGLRRKRAIGENSIERYGVVRALAAIRRADVVLLVIDATKGVTEQDTKIAGFAHEEGKACIVVVNKWDLVEKDTHTMNQFKKDIARELQFVSYAPTLFTSAVTGQRVDKIFQLIGHVYEQSMLRISTGLLNEAINQATATVQPPTDKGRRLNILYATQVAVQPPTFVLFVNDPELMHFSYKRYLENQLRHTFGFEGTPIRLYIRRREDKNA
ncbi:MAG: ribosome biogenesis GTPase Der, partial [Christensenellales bacterium]